MNTRRGVVAAALALGVSVPSLAAFEALEDRVSVLERSTATTVTTRPTPTTAGPRPAQPPTTAPPTTARPPAGVCAIDPGNGERAITAAIAGCPDGSTVRFPAGRTYQQQARIDVWDRHNLTIDGNGSTFVTTATRSSQGPRSGPNGNWVVIRGTNVSIRNMTTVGAFDTSGPGGKRDLAAASLDPESTESNTAFAIYGTKGALLEDVTARNAWGDGATTGADGYVDTRVRLADYAYTEDLTIRRMTVDKVFRMCWAPTSGINITIEDSTCRDAWYAGIDAELDTVDQPLVNHRYLRNTFDGFNHFGILVPVAGNGTRDIEIRGNVFLTATDGCFQVVLVGAYPHSNPSTFANVVVEDNDVRLAHGVAITLDHVAGGQVTDNRIDMSDDRGCNHPNAVQPITVTNSAGVTVEGNRVR